MLSAFGALQEDQFQVVSNKVHLEIAGSSHQHHHLLNIQRELRNSSPTLNPMTKESTRLSSSHTLDQSRRLLMTEFQLLKSQEAMLVQAPRDHSTQGKEPMEDGGYQSSRKLMPSSMVSMLI